MWLFFDIVVALSFSSSIRVKKKIYSSSKHNRDLQSIFCLNEGGGEFFSSTFSTSNECVCMCECVFFIASFLFLNSINFVLNVGSFISVILSQMTLTRELYVKWQSINIFVHSDKTRLNWKTGNPFLFLDSLEKLITNNTCNTI